MRVQPILYSEDVHLEIRPDEDSLLSIEIQTIYQTGCFRMG